MPPSTSTTSQCSLETSTRHRCVRSPSSARRRRCRARTAATVPGARAANDEGSNRHRRRARRRRLRASGAATAPARCRRPCLRRGARCGPGPFRASGAWHRTNATAAATSSIDSLRRAASVQPVVDREPWHACVRQQFEQLADVRDPAPGRVAAAVDHDHRRPAARAGRHERIEPQRRLALAAVTNGPADTGCDVVAVRIADGECRARRRRRDRRDGGCEWPRRAGRRGGEHDGDREARDP